MSKPETPEVVDRARLVCCALIFALSAAATVLAVRNHDAVFAAISAAFAALTAVLTIIGIYAGDYNSPSRVEARRFLDAEQMRQDRL